MSKLLTIIGPTASQKTRLAACLASELNGEILSGDSRQIYRDMNHGTGKDYDDYIVNNISIPYHLIDIADAGEKYNVYKFQSDFIDAYNDITARNCFPIFCGGTGMYIEAILGGYKLIHVPPNKFFRAECESKSYNDLVEELKKYKSLHNKTDIDTRQRLIRALEIELYYSTHPKIEVQYPQFESVILGVKVDRDIRRQRITSRLRQRLDAGLIDEVQSLINNGVNPETLIYYGLEYKYVTNYVLGNMEKEDMIEKLNIAIHQFSKRQMTWFRGMERRGYTIHWINGELDMQDRVDECLQTLKKLNFI